MIRHDTIVDCGVRRVREVRTDWPRGGQTMHVLVVRGPNALTRPDRSIPVLEELQGSIVEINSYEWGDLRVITAFTGSPPDGWVWAPIVDIQWESPFGDSMGEALLCGG
jgi:hypothetical protein